MGATRLSLPIATPGRLQGWSDTRSLPRSLLGPLDADSFSVPPGWLSENVKTN